MGSMASQITSLTIVYSAIYSGADQRKHLSSASLAFVWGIHWGPVNSPHKWPVTRKMFPFDDVIMQYEYTGMKQSNLIKTWPFDTAKSRTIKKNIYFILNSPEAHYTLSTQTSYGNTSNQGNSRHIIGLGCMD